MTQLPLSFLRTPLCHRAYHDVTAGRPENSREAIHAAVHAGYGIEIDIQRSKDGIAMVFHDYDLARLTGRSGFVATETASALGDTLLIGGATGIPTLTDILNIVDGTVPLLIEIKDQDLGLGPNVGPLEQAIAADLTGYTGDVAVMSFNPHSVAKMAHYAPEVPRGLTTDTFEPEDWKTVPDTRLKELRPIPDLERVDASFISHRMADLSNPRIKQISASGLPILCWTVKSEADEQNARQIADNITFEGYAAKHP